MRTVFPCTGRVGKSLLRPAFLVWRLSPHSSLLTVTAEADEAYVIGKRGQYTPVGAYLAGDEIIKIAVEHGAQLIHPGQF